MNQIMNQKIKLIFAEDEIETRQNIVAYINNRYNFEIIEANDGKEAWDAYLQHEPDVLITDLSMPEMDGLELIQKIREVDANLQIIVITAHTEDDKLEIANGLNIIDYHVKPLKRNALITSLDKVVERPNRHLDIQ